MVGWTTRSLILACITLAVLVGTAHHLGAGELCTLPAARDAAGHRHDAEQPDQSLPHTPTGGIRPVATRHRAPVAPNATLLGAPPALLFLAPHKTGSTFFAAFLQELSSLLGLCWYTDNAAFMWKPRDHSKCSSPSCGHPRAGKEKRFSGSDLGWGDCSGFASEQLAEATACANGSSAQCAPSVQNGLLWGPIRLPGPMRHALRLVQSRPWRWHVVLHQRHPLDVLVSGYHSFGWRHPAAPSATADQKREHDARQSAVRNQSVDEYAMANADEMRRKYAPYFELLRAPPAGVVLVRSRYEEMVTFFEQWLTGLLAALGPLYSEATLDAARRRLLRHHAGAFSPDGRHKRSVLPGRFVQELKPATIAAMLKEHRTWWAELGYV